MLDSKQGLAGFGLVWTGGSLRMKGWVDGGKDRSGETDGEQIN